MAKIKNAEEYIENHGHWKKELESLQKLIRSFDLEETIKWGAPVYMYKGKNLISIAAFKEHYAMWFFQGGLLEENTALLSNAQEGKTQAMRQIRFEKGDILDLQIISSYIDETIKQAKEGKKMKQINPAVKAGSSPALMVLLEKDEYLKQAFTQLTPGRQKEYINYIAEAKKEETKSARLEKIYPLILEGKGLNDRYSSKK